MAILKRAALLFTLYYLLSFGFIALGVGPNLGPSIILSILVFIVGFFLKEQMDQFIGDLARIPPKSRNFLSILLLIMSFGLFIFIWVTYSNFIDYEPKDIGIFHTLSLLLTITVNLTFRLLKA